MSNDWKRIALTALLVGITSAPAVFGAIAKGPIKDINKAGSGFGATQTNVFDQAWLGADADAAYNGNAIVVYTMQAGATGSGSGLSFSISNGEFAAEAPGSNLTPADPVFAAVGNASGRLENGNVLRFSMWMRQDVADPVVKEPQVESVLKFELWKQAINFDSDYANVPFSGGGNRIWDQDQNAFFHETQSQAAWIDINNDGEIFDGGAHPVAAAVPAGAWHRVETTMIVDSDPDDDAVGWTVGGVPYGVSAVEEIRATYFLGDYAGLDPTDGGSLWIDNVQMEVFKDAASMAATPNTNPDPTLSEGDYDNSGFLDGGDVLEVQQGLGTFTTAADLALITGKLQPSPIGAIPEPSTVALSVFGLGLLARRRVHGA